MGASLYRTIAQFSRFGVVHREEVKNNLHLVQSLCRRGFVQKTRRRGKVFYELTAKTLPLLEHQRKVLLEQAALLAQLSTQRSLYQALIEDARFVNEKDPDAKSFLFLGDWQLQQPVVPAQLELAKYRYYHQRGFT